MGKATGFLDYARTENTTVPPLERIQSYEPFHKPLPHDVRQEQAGRCMDCGVPFCQNGQMLCGMISGCPLHNLIPEWNDLLWNGYESQAVARLLLTNSFPEFTSRVCPALCEKACICGVHGDPVTVRDNEYELIEHAWANGLMQPQIAAVRSGKRVAVIGSGPAGLACADQLCHRGHDVTVFEKADRPGGLLMYGIPNMELEKDVILRRTALMEQEGVTFRLRTAVGQDVSAETILEDFDAVVLACGASRPRDIQAEGRDAKGIYFAVDFLTSTTKALLGGGLDQNDHISAKDKHVVVIGGGDTGNDCVGTSIRHGCASIVQLEMMPKLPDTRAESNPFPEYPRVCKTDYGQEEAIAVFGEDPRRYCTTVKAFLKDEDGKLTGVQTVRLTFDEDRRPHEVEGSEEVLPCELCLIAAGFVGCDSTLAAAFGAELTERGNVRTAQDAHRTSADKVFTAGDMHIGQSLVVRAIAEGRDAAAEVDRFLMGYTGLPGGAR